MLPRPWRPLEARTPAIFPWRDGGGASPHCTLWRLSAGDGTWSRVPRRPHKKVWPHAPEPPRQSGDGSALHRLCPGSPVPQRGLQLPGTWGRLSSWPREVRGSGSPEDCSCPVPIKQYCFTFSDFIETIPFSVYLFANYFLLGCELRSYSSLSSIFTAVYRSPV